MEKQTSVREFPLVDIIGECWLLRHATNNKGYAQLSVGHDRKELVHRLVYRIFNGPLTRWDKVMHTCDMPLCVNPAHLRKGTQAENMADMAAKGRRYKGKTNLTAHQLWYITHHCGLSSRSVAAAIGVSHTLVLQARRGELGEVNSCSDVGKPERV